VSSLWRKPDLIYNAFDNYNLRFDIFSLVFVFAPYGPAVARRLRFSLLGIALSL